MRKGPPRPVPDWYCFPIDKLLSSLRLPILDDLNKVELNTHLYKCKSSFGSQLQDFLRVQSPAVQPWSTQQTDRFQLFEAISDASVIAIGRKVSSSQQAARTSFLFHSHGH